MSLPEKRFLTLTVPPERDGARVKSLLKTEFQMAESFIARLKLTPEGIVLNGARALTADRVKTGDVLAVRVDDQTGGNEAPPVPVALDLVYEDPDLAVINKPAGLAVHGGPAGEGATLANALAALWGQAQPFHPVHRLDRGTSGLLVAAKSAYVQELLRRRLHTADFQREYLALVTGTPEPRSGVVDLPISESGDGIYRRRADPAGKPAGTEYETVGTIPGGAVLRLRPLTGRTHQLRVHMAALGCPLLGDALYGGNCAAMTRPALHAYKMTLRQPVTGTLLRLTAPLPEDMLSLMK